MNEVYRIVGATLPAEHPQRQNISKLREGLRGFFAERKVAGYARVSRLDQPDESNRTVFDRAGRILGEVAVRRDAISWNTPADVKWLYFRPILEKSTANLWSDRVIGTLTVHSSADDAPSLFKTAEFQ